MIGSILKNFFGGAAFKIGEKVTQWIPSKDEHRRNKIDKIKREMDKIQNKWTQMPATAKSVARYQYLSGKLRVLQTQAENK